MPEVPIIGGHEIVKRVAVSAEAVADLIEVAQDLVAETVASGSTCDDPTLACPCFVCRALRVLIAVEGPGRCAICGCDEDHACAPEGCGWADPERRVCDRHPLEDIATARLVLAAEEGARHA